MSVDDFTVLMKALSDSNRVRALIALRDRELCVCQLMELLELAISTVSKHMSILKQAKLVRTRKTGRWVYYSLDNTQTTQGELTDLAIKSLIESETIIRDASRIKKILNSDIEELCGKQRGAKCCPSGDK
ncbi:MAG: winged helix-turn-helix transcriptional regulator [Kiritimatiellaeota bacterium]|nr:winged helix-turn-helix transcriptional regulator [Kiritimatiellota bacterium]